MKNHRTVLNAPLCGILRRNLGSVAPLRWLYAKSIYGAAASAVIYSITETAKLNGLRPYSYLTYLLETMKNHQADTNYDFIDTLLPWSKELPEECKTSVPLERQ